jgi:hypothetical protein
MCELRKDSHALLLTVEPDAVSEAELLDHAPRKLLISARSSFFYAIVKI